MTPTRLISTGAVCDQNFCDGFTFIDCVSAAPTQQTFTKPKAVSPTRLIGKGAVCDQPFCDGFKWLVCQK